MNLPKIHLPEHWPFNLAFSTWIGILLILASAWAMSVVGGVPSVMYLLFPVLFALGAGMILIEVLPPFFKRE